MVKEDVRLVVDICNVWFYRTRIWTNQKESNVEWGTITNPRDENQRIFYYQDGIRITYKWEYNKQES